MKKKAKVKTTVIAYVMIHEDIQGNQEIEDFEDIDDVLEFEIIEEINQLYIPNKMHTT